MAGLVYKERTKRKDDGKVYGDWPGMPRRGAGFQLIRS
jgi:hypothetical protein